MNQDEKDLEHQFQVTLAARVDQEITSRLLPHLAGEADHGYPFYSEDEYLKACIWTDLDATHNRLLLKDRLSKIPSPYREAFEYIVSRDLDRILRAYLKMADVCLTRGDNSAQTPRREEA